MDTGVDGGLTRASRRTKLCRKLSRRLSLVTKVPNMISVRLRQELGGSRDSLRTGGGSQRKLLEITVIAPDKTQRIVSTMHAYFELTLRETHILRDLKTGS
jgi:hypothetical protein